MNYTTQAKKALDNAYQVAKDEHVWFVGTEHLLAGLSLTKESVAGKVLNHNEIGCTYEKIMKVRLSF